MMYLYDLNNVSAAKAMGTSSNDDNINNKNSSNQNNDNNSSISSSSRHNMASMGDAGGTTVVLEPLEKWSLGTNPRHTTIVGNSAIVSANDKNDHGKVG
jgi:hypothetical protein